jgi:uncharacterized delta-60 repeat protein
MLSAGAIDTTFGTSGATAPTSATVFALQSNNQAVTAGQVAGTTFTVGHGKNAQTYTINNVQVSRYTTSGILDTTFGGTGQVSLSLGGLATVTGVVAEKIDANGKIVVVAQGNTNVEGGGVAETVVMRLNANGSLDTTFGQNGIFTETTAVGSTSMAIDPQGRTILYVLGSPDHILRLNSNGTLDSTFGSIGIVNSALTTPGNASIALQSSSTDPNGYTIIYGGRTPSLDAELARFNSNGSLDTSFGNGGTMSFQPSVPPSEVAAGDSYYHSYIMQIALESDGSIVAAGRLTVRNLSGGYYFFDPFVAHFSANGTLDTSFGSNGYAVTVFAPDPYQNTEVQSMAIDGNGNIVVAGGDQNNELALIRYTSTGQLDTSFGNGQGYVFGPSSGPYAFRYGIGLAIQSDGKIVTLSPNNGGNSLLRYLGS